MDISTSIGTPVIAAGSGKIIYSEIGHVIQQGPQDTKFTVLIELDTPVVYEGKTVRYVYNTHLSNVNYKVKEGDGQNIHVDAGEVIGTSGIANGSPHLHFGLIIDRKGWKHLEMEKR